MQLAVMQPYLFPYIGYFQLIAEVDKFVFFDDVNYINRGWINRNRLLIGGAPRYFTVPLSGASQFAPINRIAVAPGEVWKRKMLDSVRQSYARAPHVAAVSDLLAGVLYGDGQSIADLARASVRAVCGHVGLAPALVDSAAVYENAHLAGEERIIDICRQERATCYINPPGGRALYHEERFAAHGISLRFHSPLLASYPQFGADFHPGLSILDVLMFNDPATARSMIAGPGAGTPAANPLPTKQVPP